jgi:hypothetical protein
MKERDKYDKAINIFDRQWQILPLSVGDESTYHLSHQGTVPYSNN